MAVSQPHLQAVSNQAGGKYLFPFILVTSLFFLWGFAYGLLDVLNKHFQEALNITKGRSTLLQAAYFGAYFLMALPAGMIMKKYGYKSGIIIGLLLYTAGAFLFYPAANIKSFEFFLFALFVIACGLTCLETAANPYITVLGPAKTSEFRLNLSQSFNGVGSLVGPIIAAELFFSEKNANSPNDLSNVQSVYLIIGAVVLAIAFLFIRTKLPEIKEEVSGKSNQSTVALFSHSHFVWSVIAQFFYVAAQVGIGALFINYATEYWQGTSNQDASYLLSICLLLFTAGRFAGTALMRTISPRVLLAIYSIVNVLLCAIVILFPGMIAVFALMGVFFFMSIMFPTIFALGVKNLGDQTKKASSFIIMSIVGGAIVPPIMGMISDRSTALSFIVPLVCFLVVLFFASKKSDPVN
jgi:FHS family L-fucose permease-like MFS transporter